MIYLIDGHNLIGKLPDISLSDPDDEEKLIRRLQDWRRVGRKRQIELFFDAGPIGGLGNLMGGLGVSVHFSRVGQTADDLIKRKLKQVRNPQEYTLVSSDREIVAVSRRQRIGYVLSEEFAAMMAEELSGRSANEEKAPSDPGESEEIDLPVDEIDRWMSLFDKAPRPQRPAPIENEKPAAPAAKTRPESIKPPSAEDLKNGLADLSGSELAAWMATFSNSKGDKKSGPAASSSSSSTAERSASQGSQPPLPFKRSTTPADHSQSTDDERLDENELAEWLRIFGEDPNETSEI